MSTKQDSDDSLSWFLVILAIIGFFTYKYYNVSRLDTFAVGEVEKVWKTSKGSSRLSFSYATLAGDTHQGMIANPTFSGEKEDLIGDNFIIGYNSNDPSKSFLFLDMPADDVDVDSLRSVCVPSDLVSLWIVFNHQ